MGLKDLGETLHDMYFNSNDGEAVAMIHLFAVTYAKQIKESQASMKAVALAAGINESYATEIGKGVRLSKFVTPK